MTEPSHGLSSSVHLSGAPRTALGVQPLRRIATGVGHVETMFLEMRDLEVSKDAEIASLQQQLRAAQDELSQRAEHETFLIAAVEKLERKVQRRDHTVTSLERHLRDARGEVQALKAELGEARDALQQRVRDNATVSAERHRLARDAQAALAEHESAIDALAAAEREAVQRRSDLIDADFEESGDAELRHRVVAAAMAQADLAFHRSLASIAEAKRAVALHVASLVDNNISGSGRALLGLLRDVADDIAASCRATFFSAALAAPMVDSLRRALRSSTCGGDCCVVPHRVAALCERVIMEGDSSFDVRPGGSPARASPPP